MKKYVISAIAGAVFLFCLFLFRNSNWFFPFLAIWDAVGIFWYIYFSDSFKQWKYRKKGFFREILQIVGVIVYALMWPFWLAFGEEGI